jgi:serine/threonine protein kinase
MRRKLLPASQTTPVCDHCAFPLLQVCDFGISKMKDASLAASSTRLQAGTPAYMAPEQFEGCSATEKVDVFSFAVLLWECCEQQQPWRDLSPMQIIYAVGLQVCGTQHTLHVRIPNFCLRCKCLTPIHPCANKPCCNISEWMQVASALQR